MMKWLQRLYISRLQHKYAINSALLGDLSKFAWSNLGYWDRSDLSYPQACRQLAERLAIAVKLNSKDKLLDLGCGKGASLQLWHENFAVSHIEAVEIQNECVDNIRDSFGFIHHIRQDSFLNLKLQHFEFKFDVAMCIDAAYHYDLNLFLESLTYVLNSNARVGFHSLMLSSKFEKLNALQKLKLKLLLKCADVYLHQLKNIKELNSLLNQKGYDSVCIEDQSEFVLKGFSNYICSNHQIEKIQQVDQASYFDRLKIEMTAKLCEKLYQDGFIQYVQITATYQKNNE